MPVVGVLGYETVDVTETAGGLTADYTAGFKPNSAEGVVEEAPIRYRVDGTTVTEDTGVYAAVGDRIELRNRGEVDLFSAIQADAEQGGGRVTFALGVDWQA